MPQPPILEASQLPPDAVEVGRITDAWGVKGWFKVLPYSSDPEALLASRTWFLQPAERGAKSFFAGTVLLPIRQARTHSDTIVAWAQGVDDRDGAEALRGARIFVSRAYFPQTDEDEYYWVDLEGLDVQTVDGVKLGRASHLFNTGANADAARYWMRSRNIRICTIVNIEHRSLSTLEKNLAAGFNLIVQQCNRIADVGTQTIGITHVFLQNLIIVQRLMIIKQFQLFILDGQVFLQTLSEQIGRASCRERVSSPV